MIDWNSIVVTNALKEENLISGNDNSILFYDLDEIENKLSQIKNLFPGSALHTVAVKANPLLKFLEMTGKFGFGAEAASMPEIQLALSAGIAPQKIVFDSPVKTVDELSFALNKGININADSLDELERLKILVEGKEIRSRIGVRINPQVGTGSIKSTSVAGEYSKFGVPLDEQYQRLISCFLENPWLNSVHVHIGSQGCPLQLLVRGIQKVFGFVKDVNSALGAVGRQPVSTIDIGGGMPVDYKKDGSVFTIDDYLACLAKEVPELFSPAFKLVTEFGRYISAGSGWVISRAEYVKRHKNANTVMIHVGADMFLRECYNPADWYHAINVLDRHGKTKPGLISEIYNIAGPLCFAGDIIARDTELPFVEPGDWIVINDAGAYTLGMWSRYNSRPMPKVLGFSDSGRNFRVLRRRETVDEAVKFWQ